MKTKIAITGANGTIGSVLVDSLSEKYDITQISRPDVDATRYEDLLEAFEGQKVVIHLAWDTDMDNYKSGRISPQNSLMFENVYRAAVERGVSLVIMASSVHADSFYEIEVAMSPYADSHPDSPYGAQKILMEKLGEWYVKEKGIGVICLRFGGVNSRNEASPAKDQNNSEQVRERSVWLSHNDMTSLIEKCIDSDFKKFAIVYAISDNIGRIQDVSNPFGWIPKDGVGRGEE